MANCCNPRGCDQMFSTRFARHVARHYRKHGLDRTARRMVDFLERRGIEGATILEVGGGVGEIQLELLRRGASRATNLELSPAYDEEAASLIRDAGLEQRVVRRQHDIAVDPDGVEAADVVVLHRVVCCYPDYERLLAAVADHARRLVVLSHPPHHLVARALIGFGNVTLRMRRSEFRAFSHSPAAMLEVLARHGFVPVYSRVGLVWRIVGLERA